MKQFAIACVVALTATVASAAPQSQATDTTVAPVVIKEVRPAFPKAAMKEGKQGSVWVSVRVEPNGTVSTAKVTQSLSPKLDAEAVKAAKQWRFRPGTRDGKPVAVETQLEMTFTIR